MHEQIIAELLSEYGKVRARSEQEADLRRAQIAQKAPLYGDLGAELARIMARCATTGADAEAEVHRLRARADEQLREAGYSPGDLSPRYHCPLCKDTGYVGEPIKQFCACFETRLRQRIAERSGMASAPGHTFEHFDLNVFPDDAREGLSQRDVMRRLNAFARNWAECFPDNKRRDVVLSGPTGVGKTFLLDCIAADVMDRGHSVLRITAFRMLETMRRRHFGQDDEDLLGVMLAVDLLLIDDLGTEPMMNNITVEYLFTLLNERQQANLSTLVATNLAPDELRARYGERITSRLLNAERTALFLLEGRDVRYQRAGEKRNA
jgi:DNA replication protein DnaC